MGSDLIATEHVVRARVSCAETIHLFTPTSRLQGMHRVVQVETSFSTVSRRSEVVLDQELDIPL